MNFVRSHKLLSYLLGIITVFVIFLTGSPCFKIIIRRLRKKNAAGTTKTPAQSNLHGLRGCFIVLDLLRVTRRPCFTNGLRDRSVAFGYSPVPSWVNSRLSNSVAVQTPFPLGRYRSFTRSPGCVRDSSALMSYGTVKIRCGSFSKMTR